MRAKIARALKVNGFSARSDAVKALESVLAREESWTDSLQLILDALKAKIERGELQSSIIDLDAITGVVADLSKDEDDLKDEALQLTSAFEWPKLRYDSLRRSFWLESAGERRKKICGPARAKGAMFRERFELIKQRVGRNPLFSDTRGKALRKQQAHLTPLESLLGAHGVKLCLGMLVQREEGRYYLEDCSTAVPLDLTKAKAMGGMITERCVVMAEGEIVDGTFCVETIGFPPPESREETRKASGYINLFGFTPQQEREMQELELRATDTMFVVLAEVHLDKPLVLDKLRTMFKGYSQVTPFPIFVLMGNFTSQPLGHGQDSLEQFLGYFNQLEAVIMEFPELAAEAHFIFLPGSHDPGAGNILPRPPIASMFVASLKNSLAHANFVTNPCRLRFFSQEVVLFREDLLKKMMRHSLLPLDGDGLGQATEKTESDIGEHFVRTLVDQAHLCPLPLSVRPIVWEYDHALRLYPLPDTLIFADTSEQFNWRYEDCLAMNPGSFSSGDFSFMVYRPATSQTEKVLALSCDARLQRFVHFVLPDLFQGLLGPDETQRRVGQVHEHDLGGFREGVVVLGAHRGAVGAGALDNTEVSDLRLLHHALVHGFRVAGGRRHEIARFAAMPHNHVAGDVPGLGRRDRDERMLSAVERRSQHFRHARVELQEVASASAGADDVLDLRDQRARVGDQEGAGLDLQPELTAGLLRKLLKVGLDGLAHHGQVRAGLILHAAHLVAATEVQDLDLRELAAQVQAHGAHTLPDLRVGAGADVRVDAHDLVAVLGGDLGALGRPLVPHAKARVRAAHVGLAGAAGAHARVEADAHLAARKRLAVPLQLAERAGVDLDAHFHQLLEVVGELLAAERDVAGGHASRHRAAHLEAGAGVNVQAQVGEELEDGGIRARLHGKARRQAVRIGKCQRFLGRIGQHGLAVHVGGRSDLRSDFSGLLRRQKAKAAAEFNMSPVGDSQSFPHFCLHLSMSAASATGGASAWTMPRRTFARSGAVKDFGRGERRIFRG
eukprot:scaffold743_cov267-Pinguiococcus_pyrenoidosus.AAC.24